MTVEGASLCLLLRMRVEGGRASQRQREAGADLGAVLRRQALEAAVELGDEGLDQARAEAAAARRLRRRLVRPAAAVVLDRDAGLAHGRVDVEGDADGAPVVAEGVFERVGDEL